MMIRQKTAGLRYRASLVGTGLLDCLSGPVALFENGSRDDTFLGSVFCAASSLDGDDAWMISY